MALQDIVRIITRQEWLDAPAKAVQSSVYKVYRAAGPAGAAIERFLHGNWLGHPLHVVLTDVPVGAWTAAMVFDAIEVATGDDRLAAAADKAIALGEAAALAAGLAGITDWHPFNGQRVRRLGLVHAALNSTASVLYGASLLARARGGRGVGQALSFLGYSIVAAGAYLGGHMVYELQVGIDHTSDLQEPQQFVPVLAEADLPEGQLRRVQAGDLPVVLYRQDGRIHALVEVCAHLGGPLAKGHVEDGCIVCPWHGSAFDLDTGEVRAGPSAYPQPVLDVRVREGQIEVKEHSNS